MKKNPFKEIESNKDVPEEVREKLLMELASIQLMKDVTNHFTVKFGSLLKEFFPSKKNSE